MGADPYLKAPRPGCGRLPPRLASVVVDAAVDTGPTTRGAATLLATFGGGGTTLVLGLLGGPGSGCAGCGWSAVEAFPGGSEGPGRGWPGLPR